MNNSFFKRFFIYGIFWPLVIVALSYLFFLYELPKIVGSKTFTNTLHQIVYRKTKIDFWADNIKLKTYPNLSVDLYIRKISISKGNNKKFFVSGNVYLDVSLIRPKLQTICADYVYFNKPEYDKLNLPEKKSGKKLSEISNIPFIMIENADIILENQLYVELLKFSLTPYKDYIISNIDLNVISPYWKEPVNIDGKGKLKYIDNILSADNFIISSGATNFTLSGIILDTEENYDIKIESKNLPVNLLKEIFLSIIKKKHTKKTSLKTFMILAA